MRNKNIEIVDAKGNTLILNVSTPSTFGTTIDYLHGKDGFVKAKLTGWDKHIYSFQKHYEGNWKSSNRGYLKYHGGKTYGRPSGQGDLTTHDVFFLNIEGTWGLQLFNYEDAFGVNNGGEGVVAITWVTGFSEGRFSWSVI